MNTTITFNRLFVSSELHNICFCDEFSPNANIISGRNTSGKSTLIQSLLFVFGVNDVRENLDEILDYQPLNFYFGTGIADSLFPEMTRALDRALKNEDKYFYNFLNVFWTFADPTLMSDPRFMSVMKDFGAFEVWQKRGPPDRCKAVGESYACE